MPGSFSISKISKNTLEKFCQGDEESYELVCREVNRYLKKNVHGHVFNRFQKKFVYFSPQTSQRDKEDYPEFVLDIVNHKLYPDFCREISREEDKTSWSKVKESMIPRMFFRKIKDCLSFDQFVVRLQEQKSQRISAQDWHPLSRQNMRREFFLWQVRKLFYLIYQVGIKKTPEGTVEVFMDSSNPFRRSIFLKAKTQQTRFYDFVLQRENDPVICKILESPQGNPVSWKSREANAIRIFKRSGNHKQVSLLHRYLQMDLREQALRVDLDTVNSELPLSIVRQLLDVFCGSKSSLQVYTITGFSLEKEAEKLVLSLEEFADFFPDPTLFQPENPGKLLGVHIDIGENFESLPSNISSHESSPELNNHSEENHKLYRESLRQIQIQTEKQAQVFSQDERIQSLADKLILNCQDLLQALEEKE